MSSAQSNNIGIEKIDSMDVTITESGNTYTGLAGI
jgi:hypothetical protein